MISISGGTTLLNLASVFKKDILVWALAAITFSTAGIPDALHPDFTLSEVPLPAKYWCMGVAFLQDGRMALAVTDFEGGGEVPENKSAGNKVLIVSGSSSTSSAGIKVEEVANTWSQLAGITVANDMVYVSDRDGFYKINQLTAPADPKLNRTLIVKWPDENKWNTSFQWHQWAFTPMYYKGSFYGPYSGCIRPGGPSDVEPTSSKEGGFLKWDLSGNLEAIAGGLRSPNGANVDTATGEMFVADNQGSWLPACTFALMKPGKFYGHRQTPPHAANWAESLPYEPPVAWLPYPEAGRSTTQPVRVPSGTYTGDWLMGDINTNGLRRIGLDKVGTTYNGAVFQFSLGSGNSAINRLTYGPDGALYLGTFRQVAGNWSDFESAPLYRMTPKTTANVFEMRGIHSLADGIEIEFTKPVDIATIMKGNFLTEQWQYIRMAGYGDGKQSTQGLTISNVDVSTDKLRVHLKIDGLVIDRTIHIKTSNITGGGKAPWNDETWFTLNAISTRTWNATVSTLEQNIVAKANVNTMDVIQNQGASFTINLNVAGSWKADLISPLGQIVSSKTGMGHSQFQMDAASLHGIYFITARTTSGVLMKKIVL